jgi:hypothetical protein
MRNFTRAVLLILCFSMLGYVLHGVRKAKQTTPDQIRLIDFDPMRVPVIQSLRDQSQRFFQMAVVVLGSLLGVALVKKDDRLTRRDVPEIIMVWIAIVVFGIFFYFNDLYSASLVRAYWDALSLSGKKQFPDFMDSPFFQSHYATSVQALYAGLLVSGLAVFSICKLRGSQNP